MKAVQLAFEKSFEIHCHRPDLRPRRLNMEIEQDVDADEHSIRPVADVDLVVDPVEFD
ncbi:hypothetical protein GGE07_004471 [Sinorhizobium terangae]|uniref:Uncharacterized protein n=1 Tax=Sinorhizobium terangae TaxID=110322 RepID=A0A6N7L8M1_SINTE|nr:hypothetical protein [Sinorhizobium terangae]MBB4187802.1 hypothetical protein [Sinorhizobium terangae]MQX13946.1 hypothetical protein [Sinorhizobium terangae]